MNAERLMDAIGNISDRHIAEFANVKKAFFRRTTWYKAVAVLICVIALAIIPIIQANHTPQKNYPENAIWAVSELHAEGEISAENTIRNGAVNLTSELNTLVKNQAKSASANSKDNINIFAVYVKESTGASKQYIYSSFVAPLGVEEDYMDNNIVFIPEDMLFTLKCPNDLTIILSPAKKPER